MIKCIAIDDEPLALQVIVQYCKKISFLSLEHTFTNTDQAAQYLALNSDIELLFLDIQMPDTNGIQFYHNLIKKPMVIFTTAYKDFAADGFNVDAVDYLLKPFEYDRFLKATYKAKEYLQFLSAQELKLNSLFLKVNYEIVKISLQDIELIEALDDYIKIHLPTAPILTLMTLKNIMEKLPEKEFIRVHRSFIVPLAKVQKFSKTKIWVSGKEIPIGSSYSEVYDLLLERSTPA